MPTVAFSEDLPPNYVKALRVRDAKRVTHFPEIDCWKPQYPLREFQKIGMAWLYLAERAILADETGLGKTPQLLGVTALLASRGEPHRTLIIGKKAAQAQIYAEVMKFTTLVPMMARGHRLERAAAYANPHWDVLISTYPLLLRDFRIMRSLVEAGQIAVIAFDEASEFRHHETQTATLAKLLVEGVPRIYALDATPVQNSLLDIHSICEVLKMNIFGPLPAFVREFVRMEPVKVRRHTNNGTKTLSQSQITGYKSMAKFKARIGPFMLRRRKREVEHELPALQILDQWFDLPKAQADRYAEVRAGLVSMLREGKRMQLRSSFCHLQYACDTTFAFGEDPSTSVKLDWLVEALSGDLADESIVVFSQYKHQIRDLVKRIQAHNERIRRFTVLHGPSDSSSDEDAPQPITYGVITGDTPDDERASAQAGLWDGTVRVVIGTVAIAKSLNLQAASYLININSLWNPKMMEQLVGRIDRIGSKHKSIFVINLLTRGTIEEKLQRKLQQRNAVSDYVFSEQSDIFSSLDDQTLADLLQE